MKMLKFHRLDHLSLIYKKLLDIITIKKIIIIKKK